MTVLQFVIPLLVSCLSMIYAQTLCVRREGKPAPTFPDHALGDQLSLPQAFAIRSHATRRRSVAVANEMRKNGARPKDESGTTATFVSSSRKVAKSTSVSMIRPS